MGTHANTLCQETISIKMASPAEKVNDFIEEFKKETEQIVKETFPKKVLEIDTLFKEVKSLEHGEIEQYVNIPYPVPLNSVDETDEVIPIYHLVRCMYFLNICVHSSHQQTD